MTDILAGIKKNSFAVFGRAGMDVFADPVGTRSEHADQFRADLGGSAANIAVGLCKLSGSAALITSVSDDAVGRFCVNKLNAYGVNTEYVKAVGGECRTSLALYESVVEDFQNVIYRNNAADFQVTQDDVNAFPYNQFGTFVTAGTVFAAEPSRSAHFEAYSLARSAGLPTVFDIDYRPYSWPSAEVAADVLSRAGAQSDIIVGNDEEFGFMAGALELGLQKAEDLASATAGLVVYKMGHKGAVTFFEGEEIHTGIYPVQAVKPNGAGDSFMAGLLSGLAAGQSVRDAVLRGSACAAIVVSKPGCAPAMPTENQLSEFLKDHPGPTGA